MYPEPKPRTRTVTLEIRAEQNGCPVCSGTGIVGGGMGWSTPGFLPCPHCGWIEGQPLIREDREEAT